MLILNGKIAGTWKRVLKKGRVEIVASLFTRLRNDEKEAVRAAADVYGAFLELPVVLSIRCCNADFRSLIIPAESRRVHFVGAIWRIIADSVSEVRSDARIPRPRKSISCMIARTVRSWRKPLMERR